MTTMAMPKPHRDRPINGLMAKWYASNTAEVMHEYVELARRISDEIAPGSRVLEVAPGPGYFAIELARVGSFAVTGLDISHTFVKMAAKNAAEAGVQVNFQQGSASNMPFPKESFDFLLCRAAFKNFAEPVKALQEMCRVLKPGGRGLIIDMRGDVPTHVIDEYVDGMSLTRMNKFLTRLAFKTTLLKSAYTTEQFRYMLAQTEFSSVETLESKHRARVSMTR